MRFESYENLAKTKSRVQPVNTRMVRKKNTESIEAGVFRLGQLPGTQSGNHFEKCVRKPKETEDLSGDIRTMLPIMHQKMFQSEIGSD